MSSFATEQAEVLLKTALLLCLRELAVFFKLRGKVGVGLLLVSIATASVSITGVTGVTLSAIFIFISILSGVCFFVALPFIVRAFDLVGGQIFSGHLRMALPILGFDRLGEGMEFMEGVGIADMGNFILDVGWKFVIQLLAEGSITPLDMGSEAVDIDEVLHDVLVIMHAENFKVGLGFTFRVMGSKIIF